MTIEVKVPVLPESVADALLLDWSKEVGDKVYRDELLVEVETDKVVLEVPAPADGVLTEIVEPSGSTVLAEQVLARIAPGNGAVSAESVSAKAGEKQPDAAKDSPASAAGGGRLSPAVRRLIEETGIDPAKIAGSGKDGRIIKEDVLNYMSDSAAPAKEAEAVSSGSASKSRSRPPETEDTLNRRPVWDSGERAQSRTPMTRLRQTIANRLVQSQHKAALLTTFNEVNMRPIIKLRSKYKESFEKKHGARLGFMSFFVKASVAALQRFPLVNAYIDEAEIVGHNYCDVGIAVASPRGLVVPILRSCENLSHAQIEQQIQDFGMRAGEGRIAMEELTGGTFTITNGGVFGSLLSTPIVNPPQSAILGMHKIQERPVAENGEVVIWPMMYLALSYDHRIVDGKEAVQFLVTIKDMLEDPARLLLDC